MESPRSSQIDGEDAEGPNRAGRPVEGTGIPAGDGGGKIGRMGGCGAMTTRGGTGKKTTSLR